MSKYEYSSVTGKSWASEIDRRYDSEGRLVEFNVVGPKKCPSCGQVIYYDKNGFACCDCRIWNEGVIPTEQKHTPSHDRSFALVCKH